MRRGAANSIAERISSLLRRRHQAEKAWIMQLDPGKLDELLFPLLIAFICLNFLDVYITTLALGTSSVFRELNPIVAPLLELRPYGFLIALAFKYLPIVPLAYIVFMNGRYFRNEVTIRALKLSGLVALASADLLLFYIVFIHNLLTLLLGLNFYT